MQLQIITIFPEMFKTLQYGIVGRAIKKELICLNYFNPRDFSSDKHRRVDERPYGGGPGMVMMYEPLKKAIEAAKKTLPKKQKAKVIYLTPQGKVFTQAKAAKLAQEKNLILLCGRYEGVDERLIASEVDEEYSIGDYVLSGGEIPAMVMIDAITRLLPGALGHSASAQEDSFSSGLLDYPHYTRPEKIGRHKVPAVLLSGDHQAIARWRQKEALRRTMSRRPELLSKITIE